MVAAQTLLCCGELWYVAFPNKTPLSLIFVRELILQFRETMSWDPSRNVGIVIVFLRALTWQVAGKIQATLREGGNDPTPATSSLFLPGLLLAKPSPGLLTGATAPCRG